MSDRPTLSTRERARPTFERVHELLTYDGDTGVFSWRVSRGGWIIAGRPAGRTDTYGYVQITIDGTAVLAHRLAWFVSHRRWPDGPVDHINGERADNRILNLREATSSQNGANSRLSRKSSVGLKGVTRHGKRWRAQICVNRKKKTIGVYGTAEEAHAAYVAFAEAQFQAFARPK